MRKFLATLTPLPGRAERQVHAGEHVRGLLLDGERTSIRPLVDRLPGADVQALGQFVNQSPWAWAPVQAALTQTLLDRLFPEAVLILDETSVPKKALSPREQSGAAADGAGRTTHRMAGRP